MRERRLVYGLWKIPSGNPGVKTVSKTEEKSKSFFRSTQKPLPAKNQNRFRVRNAEPK